MLAQLAGEVRIEVVHRRARLVSVDRPFGRRAARLRPPLGAIRRRVRLRDRGEAHAWEKHVLSARAFKRVGRHS